MLVFHEEGKLPREIPLEHGENQQETQPTLTNTLTLLPEFSYTVVYVNSFQTKKCILF